MLFRYAALENLLTTFKAELLIDRNRDCTGSSHPITAKKGIYPLNQWHYPGSIRCFVN